MIQGNYHKPDSMPIIEQVTGDCQLFSPSEHAIYYTRPFRRPPFLKINQEFWFQDSVQPLAEFTVTQQDSDHFAIKILKNHHYPLFLHFEAEGEVTHPNN